MSAMLTNAILQTASVAYLLTDKKMVIGEVGGAERLLPASSPSLLGANLLDVLPALRAHGAPLNALLAHGTGMLHRNVLVGGAPRAVSLAPQPNADGGLLVTIGEGARARHARRRAALPLTRRSARQAAEHNTVVPLMLATTMHELRTPLTVATGYLSLLLDEACGPLTAEQAESLHVVARNVAQIQQLSADLLDTARIGSGQLVLHLNVVDLRRIIGRVINDYQPQLVARRQRISFEAPTDLPYAWCDELRATQILMNLIGNASKYSPDGGQIVVSVHGNADGSFLEIAVADSGFGITPDDQQHVFTPFYRAPNARQSTVGSGLGLYVSRALVEAHGGAIWLKSKPEVGSTFYLTLPQSAPVALQACDV